MLNELVFSNDPCTIAKDRRNSPNLVKKEEIQNKEVTSNLKDMMRIKTLNNRGANTTRASDSLRKTRSSMDDIKNLKQQPMA